MCEAGVARSWCRVGSGSARQSRCLPGRAGTGLFSKIHLDIIIITTTTEQHYIIRIAMKVMPGSNTKGIFVFGRVGWEVCFVR